MSSNKVKNINLNDAVLLKGAIGVVLYLGPVDWDEDKSKTYVGLELSTKIPNGHNGTYHNRTYFQCKPSHGIILPIAHIIRVIKPIELLHKLTELKQVLVQESLRNTVAASPSSTSSISNHNDCPRVAVHGLLLKDNIPSDHRLRKIQLMTAPSDNGSEIGDHCIVIPNQYIQTTATSTTSAAVPREPVDSPSTNDLKPLVLKPLNNKSNGSNGTKLTNKNRRRSSISGRRYSVTARQGSMYEQWSRRMVPTMDSIDSQMDRCDAKSWKQCGAVQRVHFVLQYFNEWTFKKSNKLSISEVDRMIDFMENLENYNVVQLLNDYYHLVDFHKPQTRRVQLDSDANDNGNSGKKMFQCERMDCVSLMRHSKDLGIKNRDYRRKKVLYFIDEDDTDDFDELYYEIKRATNSRATATELIDAKDAAKQKEVSQEIIVQEILDKIHCFLCHSLATPISIDNGSFYDDTNDDINSGSNPGDISDGDLVEILHGIFSKMPEYRRIRNIRSNRNDPLFSKFTTKLVDPLFFRNNGDHKMEEIDDEELNMDLNGTPLTPQSRPNWIGRNFKYNEMEPKYGNLKQEMLSGYGLDIGAWNDLYDLSVVIQRSYKTRKMSRRRRRRSHSLLNGQNGSSPSPPQLLNEAVSSEFVLCLLLYCSFIQIRGLFLSTFQQSTSSMGAKVYSIFANMGRIVRENVNAFGREWMWPTTSQKKERVQLYHCMECVDGDDAAISLLQSAQLVFNGPVSMTSNLLTAVLCESNFFSDDVIHGRGIRGQSLRFLFGINGDYEEDEGLMLKFSLLVCGHAESCAVCLEMWK